MDPPRNSPIICRLGLIGFAIATNFMSEPRTAFLTGSTGFIGQYVLRGLLEQGRRVVVMLRGPVRQSGLRLSEIMRPLGIDVAERMAAGQLRVVEGCLPQAIPALVDIAVHQIIHAAACLQLDAQVPGEPFATNVDGVRTLSCWADAHGVSDFCFVSSAYTCGRRTAHAAEVFHRPQPEFLTDYELSKWQAEAVLQAWAERSGCRLTILRPSLVIGDSQTGYTTQYGGFYQMAHMIDVLQRFFSDQRQEGRVHLPLRLPGPPHGRQNVVPVDYVAAALVEIVGRQDRAEGIYHLTNPRPPSNEDIKHWLEAYYQVWGGSFVNASDVHGGGSLAERMFYEMNNVVLSQLTFVPEFDCSNTSAALAGSGVRFPALNDRAVFRMLDYARADKWGRPGKAAAS